MQPIRLAGPPELTTECALPAMAPLAGREFELRVSLLRPAEAVIEALARGKADIGIVTIAPGVEGGRITRLPAEEFVLVGSPEAAAGFDPADPAGPGSPPLVAVSDELPLVRRYWQSVFDRAPPDPSILGSDLRGVLALVAGGSGISVLPRYLCRRHLASGVLVDPVRPTSPPTNPLYLVVAPHATDRAQVGRVEELLIDAEW